MRGASTAALIQGLLFRVSDIRLVKVVNRRWRRLRHRSARLHGSNATNFQSHGGWLISILQHRDVLAARSLEEVHRSGMMQEQ
jgi:hypothetical protein